MAVPDTLTNLTALIDGLAKLQTSARKTIPMFLIGILATVIAAGIALYYILTLSADLREARDALQQSQTALMEARANLAAVNLSLRQSQKTAATSADARSIATAISDVSRSQASITSASSSIRDATMILGSPEKRATPDVSPDTAHVRATPSLRPEPEGTFEVMETDDGFLSLRAEPSMVSTEIAKIPSGGLLTCRNARRNVSGNLWRPCKDVEGRSGFVSNKFIQRR